MCRLNERSNSLDRQPGQGAGGSTMNETAHSVIRMANQIARNFEILGKEAAVAATQDHIASFWDRRMKAAAYGLLPSADAGFSPLAREALERLAGEADGAGHPDAS
jgi:formate dehydrogenase subunit delta